MRILIATQNYRANLNGAAVFTANLAAGLARRGHEVLVLAPSERGQAYRARQDGVDLQAVGAIPIGADVFVTVRPGPAVEQAFSRFRPELVHLQDHYPLCRSVLSAARRRHLPLVGTNNFLPENIISQVAPFRLVAPAVRRIMWDQALAVFNAVDVVTTPSRRGLRS